MPSIVQVLLLIGISLVVSGCNGEPLADQIRPIGPVKSGPLAKIEADTAKKTEPSAPVGTLIRRAERLISSKNLPGAIEALEEALVAEPTNRQALRLLVETTQQRAVELERPMNSPLFLRSAQAIRVIRETYKDLNTEEKSLLPTILYNEACTLAVNGESAKAMKSLTESLESGALPLERIDNDEELDTLRKLPEFIALQKRLEVNHIGGLMDQMASRPFPFDFKLTDLEGKPFALESLKGKVVIIDFWATWCVPCRKELPYFVSLYQKYKDKGLEIVGIDYEHETGEAISKQVQGFLKERGVTYPCVVGDDATRNQVPGFEGLPTTLFLDRAGKVRLKLSGYHSMIPLETAVEKLLAEGAGEAVGKK